MKINFVLPSIGNSGGMNVVYKYADILTKNGHDVVVYKEIAATNMYRYECNIKNKIHQFYCSMKGLYAKSQSKNPFDKFVFHLNDESIRTADITIATAWPTAFRVAGLGEKVGKKYYFVQGFEIWDNETLVKESYQLSLKKIVISSWINQKMKDEMGIGPFPVVYNGIDTFLFHAKKIVRREREISFLMLNHTLPKKGVNIGLKVFEKIRSEYKNCKFRMFGMCGRKNLPEYVEYYQNPSKDQLVELYSMSDIFLFPSLEEGWGLTPIEAMACGCAVVGTRVGFVLDFGMHGINMMISEAGDVEAMVRNVQQLIKEPELLNKLKKEGIKMVSDLDWDKSCRKLLSIFESEDNS